MPTETQIILSVTSYKVASLLVGAAFAHMGYRLFLSGIWGDAGHFSAQHSNNKLVLKNGAPGTFFALFGTIIVVVTLYKGLEFREYGDEIAVGQGVGASIGTGEELPNDLPF